MRSEDFLLLQLLWQFTQIERIKKMDHQSVSDKLAAIAVALLLILTAWGNATVMLIVAALGLAVVVFIARKNIARGGVLATTVGLVVAIAIALAKLIQ